MGNNTEAALREDADAMRLVTHEWESGALRDVQSLRRAVSTLIGIAERLAALRDAEKQTVEEALKEFHETYGLPVRDDPIDFSHENDEDAETFHLRYELVKEEYEEFLEAHENDDLAAMADAICDLVYVLVGTAVSYGIPFDKCFAEVQRSNMSKLGEDGKPIVREDGKILKGPNFSLPDLGSIINGTRPN